MKAQNRCDKAFRILSVSWPFGIQLVVFLCSSVSVVLLTPKGSPNVATHYDCRILLIVARDHTLMSKETSMRAEQPTAGRDGAFVNFSAKPQTVSMAIV